MSDSIQSLADALAVAAAKGPVTLNSAFISASGVTPPADFDELLHAGFALGDAAGLVLTFAPADVSPVVDNAFSVSSAQTAFLGTALENTNLTLWFTGNAPVEVMIQTALTNWQLSNAFPYMKGWPFDTLPFSGTGFVFTTQSGVTFSWNGTTIALEPGQNIAANTIVPAEIQPIAELLSLVGLPSSAVVFGSFDPSVANNTTILYPTMLARAILTTQTVQVLSIKARNPAIGLQVAAVEDVDDDGNPTVTQTPYVFFGLTFDVDTLASPATLQLQALFNYYGNSTSFALSSPPDSLVTPATVASLVLGESYFRYVPAELQQYLTKVGLYGISANAMLTPSPSFTSMGAALGSTPGTEWTIFGDPSNGQDFTVKEFVLNWLVLNPTAAQPSNAITFSADLQIFPKVFHTDDGQPGVFSIVIDQDLNINGAYAGSVSLDDVLREITDGAIGLPNGVEIVFSDATLAIDQSAKTYAFGFTLDASVDFVTFGSKPLLQIIDMTFALQAALPSDGGSSTYLGSISGLLGVGPLVANVAVTYDGTLSPSVWTLSADLAEPLALSELLEQFFEAYNLPSFLPGTLVVENFGIAAKLPSTSVPTSTASSSYEIYGTMRWDFTLATQQVDILAQIGLQYDATLAVAQQFSGSVIGDITLENIGAEVLLGYQFSTNAEGADSSTLFIQWEGLRAQYAFETQTVTFSLKGWSVGTLLQALMSTIGDPYFTLAAPWDILNQISLDGLNVTFNLASGAANTVTAAYKLSSPLDLGFMRINGLNFKQVGGKITIAIDGSTSVPSLGDSPLFTPSSEGQDVTSMPAVPGQGNELFDLRLLALGQRVGIVGYDQFNSVEAVINALSAVPATGGPANPVDPTTTQPGEPYYSQKNNWLVGANFGMLRVDNDYTIEIMVVFNDPDIYGLRLAFAGPKAKVLAGLVIEILYKKITNDIGLYQIDFTFPNALRTLDFGTFSVTLPSLGIQIYTNGDFLFDFGFPYNMDFSRSFTVSVIVPPGIPLLGSAGFYFGKLSSATSTSVPKTTKGTFDPVIVFGLGVQVGVGKYLDYGIFQAGFSITIFGIIEGTLAAWHPYQLGNTGDQAQVQGDYYFKLSGTFGMIGKIYGTVDFAIIKANVSLSVEVYAKVAYESFRAIPLSLSAAVSVKVTVTIDLGLFSFDISFSFAMVVTAELTMGTDQISQAPWYDGTLLTTARRSAQLRAPITLRFKQHTLAAGAAPLPVSLFVTPQFTVLGPSNGTPAEQNGAFVFLMTMDAPTANGAGNAHGSSFENLCQAMLPWLISTVSTSSTVTLEQLQALQTALAETAEPPLPASQILSFLSSGVLTLNVQPGIAGESVLSNGATIFPPLPGMSITVPAQSGGSTTLAFDAYTTITDAYRAELADLFEQLAAQVNDEGNGKTPYALASADDTPEQLSQYVFEDYFTLIARQLVQTGIDAMGSYSYLLQANDSINSIMNWALARGNAAITPADIAQPNLPHPLSSGKSLNLEGLSATVQRSETLQAIATRLSDPANPPRWTTTPAALIQTNSELRAWIAPGVPVSYSDASGSTRTYMTLPGDSFTSIALGLQTDIEHLSQDASLYTQAGLLVPANQFAVPAIIYQTGDNDTLQTIMDTFGISLDALLLPANNLTVTNIFANGSGAESIAIANLVSLYVDDVWAAVDAGDVVANTAGMAARYQLHGLRLPASSGLTLPTNFIYPSGQPEYGLYQLTGQQFPFVEQSGSYAISLAKDATLGWLEFNGSTGTTLFSVDLTQQAANLAVVLSYARAYGYNPNPSFSALAQANISAQSFAVQQYAQWSTSDFDSLLRVTGGASGATVQALLWQLPTNVLRFVQGRSAALATQLDLLASLPYLPLVQPQIGVTDEASKDTVYTPATQYAFSTRVDFQIRRLAQEEGFGAQRPTSTDAVPPSSGNTGSPGTPLAPNNYELIGTSPTDGALLERLLTAMTTLGNGIVSNLFLLQPAGGSGTTGLTSRAASEFLSFITQTNLSTETNPPALSAQKATADEAPARGIVDSPREFIQLLWELSTVRSGGYYFYYETPGNADPFPSDIFNTEGVATLTLVIAYDRTSTQIAAGRLTNFVNALITTQAIDVARSVMSLLSQSSPAQSAPLNAGATLNQLLALYGAAPGTLADLNSSAPLAVGAAMPIIGALHQLTQTDLQAPDPFAALASYYSQGAQTPLTGQQIRDYNPGVSAQLNALVRIPTLTYVVSTTAAPGNTFASLANYFALSLDTLAAAAKSVPGIFAAASVLNVDSIAYAVQTALGTGNIGFSLSRANLGRPVLPSNPTQAQKDAYGKAYLWSLYSLLLPALTENVFFSQSPSGLPTGPTTSPTGEALQALRRPKSRRAYLSASTNDSNLDYEQVISFVNYAKVNPAPAGGGALPPASANPYIGVGSFAQLDISWVDIFGNQTTLVTPPSVLPIPIDYTDRPIGLSQWPNVMSSYTYSGDAANPALSITLQLQGDAYADATKAATDLALYQQIYFQLEQNYDSLGIPGLSGYAISMSVVNSLFSSSEVPLPTSEQQKLRDFVKACTSYVSARAAGSSAGNAPSTALSLAFALSDIVATDIIPLNLAFLLSRQAQLSDPALRARTNGLQAPTAIAPVSDTSDGVTLGRFATDMESIFKTSAWQLRVGTTNTDPSQSSSSSTSVWAVRMGLTPGIGLQYHIDPHASFYAPKPVANALRSGVASILSYSTGQALPAQGTPLTFNGVDLNIWSQQTLSAVDAFLSATYASPGYIVDVLTFADPESEGYIAKILEHKQMLASAIARSVAPILEDSLTDSLTQQAAQDKMLQQLLNLLGSAYSVSAMVVFSVSGASYSGVLPPGVNAPRFFGIPSRSALAPSDTDSDHNYSLSSAKIALTSDASGASRLAFAFNSKNLTTLPYVALPLQYAVSYLEHAITSVPGIPNYEQSSWITFVTGPFVTPIGDGVTPIDIPVVLRELPPPPTLVVQTALPFEQQSNGRALLQAEARPQELAAWNYSFTYDGSRIAQDSLQATVELNLADGLYASTSPDDALFQALAQFTASSAQILNDFNAFLRFVDANSTASDTTVINAKYALAAFEQFVGAFAQAYDAWSRPAQQLNAAELPTQTSFTFDIALEPYGAESQALSNVFFVEISPSGAQLPAPVVDVNIDGYTPEALVPPTSGALASYRYKHVDPTTGQVSYLPYDQALAQAQRTITLRELDLFEFQNAKASLEGQRNVFLVPNVTTTPIFTFVTPEISFASPIIPLLSYAEYDLASVKAGPLADALTAFFQQLFADSGDQEVLVSVLASFSYTLAQVPGLPRTSLPISLLPPTDTSGTNLAWITPLVNAIESWRASNNPDESQADARYDFTVHIFASSASDANSALKQPLLSLEDLYLSAKLAFPAAVGVR